MKGSFSQKISGLRNKIATNGFFRIISKVWEIIIFDFPRKPTELKVDTFAKNLKFKCQ